MRSKTIRALGLWLCMGTISLAACSKKKSNEGFPPAIDDLNGDDFEDGLWQKIRTNLGIDAIEGVDPSDVTTNLGTPSSLISDPEQFEIMTLAQTTAVVGNAEQSVCAEVKAALVVFNPGAQAGITGGYYLNGTTPTVLAAPTKVYWMQYKLMGDANYRSAILSVPTTPPATAHAANAALGVKTEASGTYGYPVLMYGHAGAGGLAYEEIAQAFGQLQSDFIIAAPTFPGEPLCGTYDTVAGVKSTTCTGTNMLAAATGAFAPYENDSVDLVGLHDCVKNLAAGAAKAVVDASGASQGTEDIKAKVVKINATAATAVAAADAPVSIMTGMGRGAGAAGLALARAGALNSVLFSTNTDDATKEAQTTLTQKGAKPDLYSCSLLFAPEASFTSGANKVLLDYWAKEASGILTSEEEAAAELIPGFAAIHAKIKGIRENAALDIDTKATQIAEYVKAIDLSMHLPLLHGGLQNFGKQFTAKLQAAADATASAKTAAAAQGALLDLHGEKDQIADISNSAFFASVGEQVSASLKVDGKIPGVNWLALQVTPPDSSLDPETGELLPGDYGHVSNASFLNGTTIDQGIPSNIDTASFLGKTPAATTLLWFTSQCLPAMTADAAP